MSNHDGSYLINEILFILEEYEVFSFLGKEKTLKFLDVIRKLSYDHDCNDGEILDEIGENLGVCYFCWKYGDNLQDGLCEKCQRK